MINLYDRAVCAAELNLSNQILNKIHAVRTPTHAFEVPNEGTAAQETKKPLEEYSVDSASVASTSSPAKKEIDISKLEDD